MTFHRRFRGTLKHQGPRPLQSPSWRSTWSPTTTTATPRTQQPSTMADQNRGLPSSTSMPTLGPAGTQDSADDERLTGLPRSSTNPELRTKASSTLARTGTDKRSAAGSSNAIANGDSLARLDINDDGTRRGAAIPQPPPQSHTPAASSSSSSTTVTPGAEVLANQEQQDTRQTQSASPAARRAASPGNDESIWVYSPGPASLPRTALSDVLPMPLVSYDTELLARTAESDSYAYANPPGGWTRSIREDGDVGAPRVDEFGLSRVDDAAAPGMSSFDTRTVATAGMSRVNTVGTPPVVAAPTPRVTSRGTPTVAASPTPRAHSSNTPPVAAAAITPRENSVAAHPRLRRKTVGNESVLGPAQDLACPLLPGPAWNAQQVRYVNTVEIPQIILTPPQLLYTAPPPSTVTFDIRSTHHTGIRIGNASSTGNAFTTEHEGPFGTSNTYSHGRTPTDPFIDTASSTPSASTQRNPAAEPSLPPPPTIAIPPFTSFIPPPPANPIPLPLANPLGTTANLPRTQPAIDTFVHTLGARERWIRLEAIRIRQLYEHVQSTGARYQQSGSQEDYTAYRAAVRAMQGATNRENAAERRRAFLASPQPFFPGHGGEGGAGGHEMQRSDGITTEMLDTLSEGEQTELRTILVIVASARVLQWTKSNGKQFINAKAVFLMHSCVHVQYAYGFPTLLAQRLAVYVSAKLLSNVPSWNGGITGDSGGNGQNFWCS
ncbi:hypothetical protein IQ07DRAFT_599608 [Pyrenochaeta sp. DS3sAY3a]|nr:hypothetical protein IQ07DRAFT_599608 [Pyrenochaeta sp. DS3sAY3a]